MDEFLKGKTPGKTFLFLFYEYLRMMTWLKLSALSSKSSPDPLDGLPTNFRRHKTVTWRQVQIETHSICRSSRCYFRRSRLNSPEGRKDSRFRRALAAASPGRLHNAFSLSQRINHDATRLATFPTLISREPAVLDNETKRAIIIHISLFPCTTEKVYQSSFCQLTILESISSFFLCRALNHLDLNNIFRVVKYSRAIDTTWNVFVGVGLN